MLRRTQQILSDVKLQIRGTYNNRVADAAMDKGRTMQRGVERTVVVVFLTFLFEAIYACMYALAFSGDDLQTECGQCDGCQDLPTVMYTWFMFNPEVRQIASLTSAPAALLLALYGMVGQRERKTLIPAIFSLGLRERESLIPAYPDLASPNASSSNTSSETRRTPSYCRDNEASSDNDNE